MLPIHISAGLLALLAGAMALLARKGGELHRRAGLVFVAAMLCMSASGALLALLKPEWLSLSAGLLTFYLVATGWLTVLRPVAQSRTLLRGLMGFGLLTGVFAWIAGLALLGGRSRGTAVGCFIFGGIALLCAAADWRLLRRGVIEAGPRLVRHLGRLGFALFVANASFFLGQAKLFPPGLRRSGLLSVPVFAVVLLTLYWLLRVRRRRRPLPARATVKEETADLQGAAPGG